MSRERRIAKSLRRILRLGIPVVFALTVAGVVFLWILSHRHPASPTSSLTTVPAIAPVPPIREHREAIARGTTIAEILAGHGFSSKDIHEIKERVKPVYDLGRITAGREIRLRETPEGKWTALEYEIDENRYLVVQNGAGGIRAEIKAIPYEIRAAFIQASIEDSPIAAVNRAGEEDAVALELSDIFGSDIDFYTDIRKGDEIRVVFEKKYLNGRFYGYGKILAAEFKNQDKIFKAYRFTYPDTGKSDFFDGEGNSLRKEFLKSPMKFARITSRFSLSRLHPIRKIYRPHYGVDYAAPVGSPVQATADGTVVQAGWNGAAGRMIKLRHKNGYETMYLHLSGLAAGIRVGARVDAKQVIGYVGSSGGSTGPHLDYRIIYHGSHVNPMGWKFRPADPLRREFLALFKAEAEKLDLALISPWIYLASIAVLSFS